ncbi:HET-domain-containing protein, partial [Zopfia rhizophila CBS 207.26]
NACFSLARNWIKNCLENHTKCSQHQRIVHHDWNPTRLVEIGKEGICSKLCEGNQIGASVPYATLSHRWGKISDKRVLTKEEKASFQKALPESDLSQTFRDAITAARMLGFDYIWIDSLCIIQDSRDDWLNELSQMGKVYEDSTLTITATSSKDDNGGCFFSRD